VSSAGRFGAMPDGGRAMLYAFAAALLLRLVWTMAVPIVPISDSHAYDIFARNLAAGHGYGWEPDKPSAFWPVGTSAIYAFLYWLVGHAYFAIALFQVAVGVGIVVVAALLARRWLGEGVATVTAWLLACWPLLIQYTTILASELYFLLFLLSAYWLASMPGRAVSLRGWSSGVFLAAANYVRPIALLMPPLLFLKEAGEGPTRRQALLACAVCILTTLACIAPWSARNWLVFDRFVLISTNGGSNLWMGNNPDGDTGYMRLPKLDIENEADRDRVFRDRATAFIREDPLSFVKRSLKKAVVLHDRESIGVAWNEQGLTKRFGAGVLTPLKVLSSVYWWLVLVFAVCGTFLLARLFGWSVLLACPPIAAWAYITLVHSISVAGDRYHVPAIPFIAMVAGFAACRLARSRLGTPLSVPETRSG
jgi:4-amino-4-deoxy-L-arabinose transferase-like glycosyltransferase